MQVEPYLFFEGRTEEALEFYKKALGAKVEMMMRNKESPEPPPPGMNAPADKIMHASFLVDGGRVMASDGMCTGKANFQGFSLAVTAANESDAKKRFNALAEGGQVKMPLTRTFFSPAFGMLTDRFGLGWMVMVPGQSKP
jgi:PhnB protein